MSRGENNTTGAGLDYGAPFGNALGPIQHIDVPMRRYGEEEVDYIVVGVGSAGGVLLQRLARAGFRVVGLEAGPFWDTERDWVSDEAGSHNLYWEDLRQNVVEDCRNQRRFLRSKEAQFERTRHALLNRFAGGGIPRILLAERREARIITGLRAILGFHFSLRSRLASRPSTPHALNSSGASTGGPYMML